MPKQTIKPHKKQPTKQLAQSRIRSLQSRYRPMELMVVAVAFGLIVALSIFFIGNRDSAKFAREVAANPQPENITNYIKTKLADNYNMVDFVPGGDIQAGEIAYDIDVNSPLYKPDGYSFYTDYEGGSSLGLHPGPKANEDYDVRPIDKEVRKTILDTLEELGLKQTGSDLSDGDTYPTLTYTGKGLVCKTSPIEANFQDGSVTCGRISEYTSAANEADPFIRAMADKQNPKTVNIDVNDDFFIANLDIEVPNSNGFTRAKASVGEVDLIGSSPAMFYKIGDDGEWKFFARTQMTLQCDSYDTEELRKVFKGDPCFKDRVETVVQ